MAISDTGHHYLVIQTQLLKRTQYAAQSTDGTSVVTPDQHDFGIFIRGGNMITQNI